jgi:hypothetical protein
MAEPTDKSNTPEIRSTIMPIHIIPYGAIAVWTASIFAGSTEYGVATRSNKNKNTARVTATDSLFLKIPQRFWFVILNVGFFSMYKYP